MAVKDPVKVPQKDITSLDITGFAGGLNLLGEENAKGNEIVDSGNVELSVDGFLQPRKSLEKWLPDTVGTSYEKYPAIWEGIIYNFTADDGKIKWCVAGDNEWTDCGGDNSITMGDRVKIKFLRILDVLLILGGAGGNKLAYVDLATKNVVKYSFVADPTDPLTAVATGITASGSYKIYYGYTYSSAVGETLISPILEQDISKPRDQWDPDGGEYLTITRPDFGSEPAGARFWNLYIALAANGGVIQDSDMLMLAGGLDLNQGSIVDNGTLAIDVGRGNPPFENSTDGPRAKHGIETNGRPVLYGIVDENGNDTGDVLIGGDGEYALDFSASNGGFRSQPSKGTNYYPNVVIGFRNGQGIPSLTILFSNTQGIGKQATLEQQTINYGNQSFVVWGVTEQNYGAAGVAAAYSAINYKGRLSFFSTDGPMTMDTQPQLQNVLATRGIDDKINPYMRRIKVEALQEIIGTAWENKEMWLIPAAGFDTPTNIAIHDLNNDGAWYILDIAADWIGTVSPPDSPAFVYISQGNKTLKLFDSFGTVDYIDGPTNFETWATGALIGFKESYNSYQALVQAVFYVRNFIGNIEVGVNYRNLNGVMKTKSKIFEGPVYVRSWAGSWDDPQFNYNSFPMPAGWDAQVELSETNSAVERITKRIPLNINDLASAVQWWYRTAAGYNDYQLRVVSFEGENLGVKPDLR